MRPCNRPRPNVCEQDKQPPGLQVLLCGQPVEQARILQQMDRDLPQTYAGCLGHSHSHSKLARAAAPKTLAMQEDWEISSHLASSLAQILASLLGLCTSLGSQTVGPSSRQRASPMLSSSRISSLVCPIHARLALPVQPITTRQPVILTIFLQLSQPALSAGAWESFSVSCSAATSQAQSQPQVSMMVLRLPGERPTVER